jgi:phosphonopyruvate decarboxylase
LEKNGNPRDILNKAWHDMHSSEQPVAILVRNKTFKSNIKIYKNDKKLILRENFLDKFVRLTSTTDMIVSTTGKTSRELYEIKKAIGDIDREFLVIGGMGHSSGISMGLALSNPNRRIFCLDGDGSMLMHLGSLPTIGYNSITNFTYILINNGCHESVGGQPTVINKLNVKKLSESFNFITYSKISHLKELDLIFKKIEIKGGPHFIEVLVQNKSRNNLIRPSETPKMLKSKFMTYVKKNHENTF